MSKGIFYIEHFWIIGPNGFLICLSVNLHLLGLCSFEYAGENDSIFTRQSAQSDIIENDVVHMHSTYWFPPFLSYLPEKDL